jgi:DnaJ-class molecular chaperone
MAGDEPIPDTQCRACRGTGRVISGLGGTPNEIVCPWCEGSGEFIPEHNAQEAGAALRGDAPAA